MRNATRQTFDQFCAQVARLNGVSDVTTKFGVEPSVEQRLETKIQESSEFLQMINISGVEQQEGEKLGLGISGPVASTTDTDSKDRETKDLTGLDPFKYRCEQTNFDTHLKYGKLDAWAKFPDFQTRIRDVIAQRIALDRLMIGWNGTHRADTSDISANPKLQDVNIGWLQHARDKASDRVMTEGDEATDEVRVAMGENASGYDYSTLDALVYDAANNLLEPWYTEDTELVVILGRELLADKYFPLISKHSSTPTESQALDVMMSAKRVGGYQAVRVPFFPARSLALTRLDNLSIYWQEGTRRRMIRDNPKRDRIEDYQSVNEAYVIEDLGGFAAVENIKVPDGSGGWE